MKNDLHSVDPIVASVVPADDADELVHGDLGTERGWQGGIGGVQMPNEEPDENGYNW
jgi:hypothetical protein